MPCTGFSCQALALGFSDGVGQSQPRYHHNPIDDSLFIRVRVTLSGHRAAAWFRHPANQELLFTNLETSNYVYVLEKKAPHKLLEAFVNSGDMATNSCKLCKWQHLAVTQTILPPPTS